MTADAACIFCRIARGEIPAAKVYEDEHVLAFYDIAPQAPVHVLVIPKRHAGELLEARAFDDSLLAHLLRTAAEVAAQLGIDKSGFRVVTNCGPDARQSVQHLHLHILGGKQLSLEMD